MASKDKKRIYQMTPATTLKSLLAEAVNSSERVAKINGSMNKQIAEAKEHRHLHPKAFSIVRQIKRVAIGDNGDIKLHELLTFLDDYLEKSGLRDQAAKVDRLPLGDNVEDLDKKRSEKTDEKPQTEAAE